MLLDSFIAHALADNEYVLAGLPRTNACLPHPPHQHALNFGLLDFCSCCRAQSDKIFAQQSSLGKAQEEVRALRGQLEGRAAQQGVIEAEIRRQVEEYGRLKRQLVEQEELQVGCIAGGVWLWHWIGIRAYAVLFVGCCSMLHAAAATGLLNMVF